MSITEIILLSLGLAADAFAVSVCKGLAVQRVTLKHMITVGVWFGFFQALMPLAGFYMGEIFDEYITAIDHWIAFALLGFIGVKMIVEAFTAGDEQADSSFSFGTMLLMAVATSIDALAVGVTFSLLKNVNIYFNVLSIGVITFLLSAFGIRAGRFFGKRLKNKAETVGGFILILIGLKILLQDLNLL